jgi:hypothetical protein
MPASLEPPQTDLVLVDKIINVVRPDDAFGATPRWVALDQAPVSRFEEGDSR